MPTTAPTVLDLLRLTTDYLGDRGGSDAPRLEAELLLAHGLAIRRLDVYLQFERQLDDTEVAAIRELVRRRARGEPIAYIVGVREFYGRSFIVSPAVLIPRPETETLVGRALIAARECGDHVRIADLATGSGCIGCSLAAELPLASVIASDVSAAAVAVATENASRLGVAERVRVVAASWADALSDDVDIIVSNPPYVSAAELVELPRDVAGFEPRLALDGGEDGLVAYRNLLAAIAERCPGVRWTGLEVDSRRAGEVVALAGSTWPAAAIAVVDDLAGRPRVVEITHDPPG